MPAFQSTTTPGLPRPTKQEAETGRSPPPKAQARTTDGARPRRDGRRRGGQGVAGEGLDAANSTASIRAGSTGRADPAAGRAAFASFEARVLSHLARHKRYPDAARRQDLRGRVAVTFSLDAGGQVISVGLAGSSGHPILDQEALAMMRRASPFPSIPPESGRTTVGFTAPVLYETR
jgi:protein TonB